MRVPVTLWLCTAPTDMRRSYNGLSAMVRGQLGGDPLSGHGFVFINRRRTQLKCLYFEPGGYCIWSKRLERGHFGVTHPQTGQVQCLSPAEFAALVEGLDWELKRQRKRWSTGAVSRPDKV